MFKTLEFLYTTMGNERVNFSTFQQIVVYDKIFAIKCQMEIYKINTGG